MNENFLLPLPPEDMANREKIREFTTRGKEIVKAQYLNIQVRPGFNERDEWGDIPALGTSILEEGLLIPLFVEMLKDGRCFLIDGERRFKGIGWLRSQGHDYDYVDVIIVPKGLTDTERLLMMCNLNNGGKRHTELEEGRIYRRLVNLGMSAALIARKVGVSEMIVGNRLRLDSLSDEEKRSISAGEISFTAALALARAESDPAVRQEVIASNNDDGPLRVKEVLELSETKKKNKLLDSIPSSSPHNEKEDGGDPYAPEQSSRGRLLISECLLILKAIDHEMISIERVSVSEKKIGELTLKIENNLIQLRAIVS